MPRHVSARDRERDSRPAARRRIRAARDGARHTPDARRGRRDDGRPRRRAPVAGGHEAGRGLGARPATRRSGVQIGVGLGTGVVSIAGFPSDPERIGLASSYTATGVHPGGWFTLWVGGALSDWLAFGVGGGGGSMIGLPEGQAATMGAFLFHVEGYPLFALGGRLGDLGVWLDAGTGSVTLENEKSDTTLVESGASSLVGFGVFYEGLRFWRMGAGPFLATNYMWSES